MRRLCKRGVRLAAAMVLALPAMLPAAADTLTITAMGDSLTQGYGLPQDEGLVPVLEGWLRDHGHDVNVINAGVSGDTTAGGLARVEWTLADDPDALILAFGGNDLLRGLDPAESRANLDGILAAAAAHDVPVLLAGLPAPGNYGPEFRQAFEAMYPELAAAHGALLLPNLLQPMADKMQMGQPLADLMQDDHLHPSAEGVRQIVETLGPLVEDLIARTAVGQ